MQTAALVMAATAATVAMVAVVAVVAMVVAKVEAGAKGLALARANQVAYRLRSSPRPSDLASSRLPAPKNPTLLQRYQSNKTQ